MKPRPLGRYHEPMGDSFPTEFHPLIEPWFLKTYGKPTAVQTAAWPRIAGGEHVLALAPTGSGKTLAAFLGALSRFAAGTYDPKRLSVVYVSPLKALNEDIRRNLQEPLASLEERFRAEGLAFPEIRVKTRSGDTPQSERRRFLSFPPSILATTPESLALLLESPRARPVLSSVRLVILDEVHAVLDTKRGAFLACQIGALSLLAGEFQRVALSATVRPPEAAARFVGARRRVLSQGGGFRFVDRPVAVVDPPAEKILELRVEFPPPSGPSGAAIGGPGKAGTLDDSRYGALVNALAAKARVNRSTLVFTDSRRRAERIAFLLNEKAGAGTAYAHHGSLSKEVRGLVEERLKRGELPCVVATGSLELGIDVGAVDEVALAGTPPAVSATLQRVGRSGHGVGRASRGTIFPFHGMDLLRSASLAGAVRDREIETSRPVENPLDILAQAVLSLCALEARNADALYDEIRCFPPFVTLSRESYDAVVEMLAGRYEEARLRELKPRLRYDRISGTLSAADGTLQLLYSSGGAIPDRGVYSLRLADGTRIGELDEEFVWERRVGDGFSFGTRSWRIVALESEAVVVEPLARPTDFVPFWKAEDRYGSPIVARRTLELLEASDSGGLDGRLEALGFSKEAREALEGFLDSQRGAQGGVPLPGPGRVTLELCSDAAQRGDALTAVLHTLRGQAVNQPLALALASELEAATGLRMDARADEDCVLVTLPRAPGVDPERVLAAALKSLGDPPELERRVQERLEGSGVFGAAFREAAGRSLLIPRASFGKRTPFWITRLRAKKLFEAVRGFRDFPMTAEAWRTCLADFFDMDSLRLLCRGMADGSVETPIFRTRSPSPFAREAVWQETNRYMYEGDEDSGRRGASLSEKAIREALASGAERPALPAPVVADFVSRLRRERPLWAPDDGPSLAEWVKERTALPSDEWEALGILLGEEARAALEADPTLGSRVFELPVPGGFLVVHEENRAALESDPLRLLGPWLRYEGPVEARRAAQVFGVSEARALSALEELASSGEASSGVRVSGSESEFFCDTENLELLLRLKRKAARPESAERPVSDLVPFLAGLQGLRGGDSRPPWEALSCWTAPAELWETELLPSRRPGYGPALLDAAFLDGRLAWFGAGKGIVGLCPPEDLDLALPERASASALVPEGLKDFWEIRDSSGLESGDCARSLWSEAWKGLVSSDAWESVRSGIVSGFGKADPPEARQTETAPFGTPRRVPRALRERWRGGPPVRGRWFSLAEEEELDPLDREALDRERVRVLGRRWGILCRPLLERELPAFGWARLLPALRRMELSGELLAGRFFSGLGGLQFMTSAAFESFRALDAEKGVYWMNARDPASLSGVAAEGLSEPLPPRLVSTRLCYRGSSLAAVALRGGRELKVFAGEDDAGLPEILSFLALPRTRAALPVGKVAVETINGRKAASSPFAPVLKDLGFETDRGALVLW